MVAGEGNVLRVSIIVVRMGQCSLAILTFFPEIKKVYFFIKVNGHFPWREHDLERFILLFPPR